METSAKDDNNVEQAFLTMAKQIKDVMGTSNNTDQDGSTVKIGPGASIATNKGCCLY